jgi:hypothetical protein
VTAAGLDGTGDGRSGGLLSSWAGLRREGLLEVAVADWTGCASPSGEVASRSARVPSVFSIKINSLAMTNKPAKLTAPSFAALWASRKSSDLRL